MAESKNNKPQQNPDAFADELDSMLDMDAASEQVGLIDDDDAIDRLLIGDVFEDEDDNSRDGLNDIDQLLAMDDLDKPASELDEFGDDLDDLIANTPIDIKPDKLSVPEEMPAVETVLVLDEVDTSPLETVGEIDEFDEEMALVTDHKTEPNLSLTDDELDNMTEIDEFSDEAATNSTDNSDFLLADFDISSDDDLDLVSSPLINSVESLPVESDPLLSETLSSNNSLLEENIEDSSSEAFFPASSLRENEPISEPPQASRGLDDESAALIAQQAAAIASLTTQIQSLTKQQTVFTRDLHAKLNQEELNACLESIESLQTEQKKTKRSVDAISAKKPVSAYVANGVAAVALLIGIGLAVQVYIASSQVTQLVEMMNTLQTQVTTGPANDAAEKEMLQKQVDELTRLNSANTDQIAELSKVLHSGGEAGHDATPGGDMGNQLTQLSNQDMQMGAAIESLQHKIAALEKGKAPVATVAKPVAKKAEPVKENWMVNLVAFKQDWYAKRKAEEFAAKGVPAKVMKTETKGESWYRLSVDGFSSQYEAAAYAARVKKTLNLDSVWVNKN
jgi:hypothetical protein